MVVSSLFLRFPGLKLIKARRKNKGISARAQDLMG
jgi:hypothetical protein